MTKNLRKVIAERDQMYIEYVKDISHQVGGKLSQAISESLFEGQQVEAVIQNINLVSQNINYVSLSVIAKHHDKNYGLEEESIMGSTINFSIPVEILESGSAEEIAEYMTALQNDTEAVGKPITDQTENEIDYVRDILARIRQENKKKKYSLTEKDDEKVEYADVDLDETQKTLIEYTTMTNTKH